MAEYVERENIALAIQLKEDNVKDVIDWLIHQEFEYSYDEIKSGGHLIVYTKNGRPFIVGEGWWVVLYYGDIDVMDDAIFTQKFMLRSV